MKKSVLLLYRYLFGRMSAERLNYLLLDCALRGLGVGNYENSRVSGELFVVEKILPRIIAREPTLFDVGANVGDYSALLRMRIPGARIHAFEPNPQTFAILKNRHGTEVSCVNIGLSEIPGDLVLYGRSDHSCSEHASLYPDVIRSIHGAKPNEIRIKLDTLDHYVKTNGIEVVDFLKIDTEGHELKVLQGAAETLARKAVRIIQIEFNEMNIVSRVFLEDFRRYLVGFELFRLLPTGLLPIPKRAVYGEIFGFQNVLAIRNCDLELVKRLSKEA